MSTDETWDNSCLGCAAVGRFHATVVSQVARVLTEGEPRHGLQWE